MKEMKEPNIIDCTMTNCAYNGDKECHAMAITVGDDDCPMCDTFWKDGKKGGITEKTGIVGACRAADCVYNNALECNADGIHVSAHRKHPDCMTFREKSA